MSATRSEGQMNPSNEIDVMAVDLQRKVSATTKALDDNRHSIHRWFWKGLFAINLILWSFAAVIVFVLRFG